MPQQLVVLLLFLHFLPPTHSRWLFAPKPTTYLEGSLIPLKVNKITSTHTGTPFPYYSLPFCTPQNTNYDPDRDVATILRGDHFEDSLYEIRALETIDCMVTNYLPSVNDSDACTVYGEEKLQEFIRKVRLNYTVHWMLDDLPAAVPNLRQDQTVEGLPKFEKQYFIGFPLGDAKDKGVWINNHVDINIVYRGAPNPADGIVILGFEIAPRSQWYDPESWSDSEEGPKKLSACPHTPYGRQSLVLNYEPGEEGSEKETTKRIFWTYSVHWELNEQTEWDDRWAVYLRDASTEQMHVISIMNAIIIVLFLMVPVIAIVKRSVFDESSHHPSSSRNSTTHAQEENAHHHTHTHTHTHAHSRAHDEDETRWKLLGVEALRAPAYPLVLSVLLGSGVHVICMMFVVIIFGMCGFMLPLEQGTFTIPMLVLFLTMGVLAGFWTMQSYKVFHGTHRIHTALATGIAFPALVFVLFLASVIAQHAAHSSAALPYLRFAEILMLWFGVSVPLVAVGNYLGFLKRTSDDNRVHTNSLLRTVRKGVWYQRPLFSVLFSGVLPFGVVVIEYFFILNALWDKPIYNSYRYLFVSIISLFITSASTNLVACFYQLNSGDHQWWWRPFLHGAASAAYMLIYSSIILLTSFKLKTSASFVLYFSFALFSSTVFFLLTSTIGFITCYFFVQTIYKHVHLLPVN